MGDTEPSLTPEQALAEQFYAWEVRGRGWQVWDGPVSPEPPFRPFFGHWLAERPAVDDGRKPTLISGLIDWLHQRIGGGRQRDPINLSNAEDSEEPTPVEWVDPDAWLELRISVPSDLIIDKTTAEQFLLNLTSCRRVIAFEMLGLANQVLIQIACGEDDADYIERQLQAHFPDTVVSRHSDALADAWDDAGGGEAAVVEFGLDREFMLPLATPRNFTADPLAGVIGALSDVAGGEVALLQILFQPVSHPWAESILRAVVSCDGTPFFCDVTRDLVGQAKVKASRPLYGVVVRAACRSDREGRGWELAARLAGTLSSWADPAGNELIPLENDNYDSDDHASDVPLRRSP